MKLFSSIAAVVVIGNSSMVPATVNAAGFVPCSFNYEIIPCRQDYRQAGGIRIIWSDGKAMTYYGARRNRSYLEDSRGGQWRYLDFDTGRAFSLSNPNNGNVIIWNGTYKEYGEYVGL